LTLTLDLVVVASGMRAIRYEQGRREALTDVETEVGADFSEPLN